MMAGWMVNDWGLGYGLFCWLIILLFWVLIIAGVVLVVRWFVDQGEAKGLGTEQTALDILKNRHAKGEVNKKQFETMKRELT